MKEHKIVAIPLNREPVRSFLKKTSSRPIGAQIRILGQRPSIASELEWVERLKNNPSIESLMWRDHPKHLITETTTDRIIPVEYVQNDEEYLTRNLGGWSPVLFGLMEADDDAWRNDPLLSGAKVLASYGNDIRYYGSDDELVRPRLMKEFGSDDIELICRAIRRLHNWRKSHHFTRSAIDMMNCADLLYGDLMNEGDLSTGDGASPAVPRSLLVDELMGQFVRIELARRTFVANGNLDAARDISRWQSSCQNNHGLQLILKGEYVMGRQRRSTILIAGELGIVVKQPGAEPFHEAKLGAHLHNGSPENWPVLTGSGAVVTPAGRMRLTIEQGLIIQLNHIFGHNIRCISSLGFIMEPYISGPTLQEFLLENPSKLTPELYEYVLLHQLICEELGVENGDWHAANFIVLKSERSPFADNISKMIHIDWGAARPLDEVEMTKEKQLERMNQVLNIGFSFHDKKLASDVKRLHEELINDNQRLKKLKGLAANIVTDH